MRRLFLSDIHLSPRDPGATALLKDFLRRECRPGDELYILGDLFDYWIGPKHLDLPDYAEALEALRAATAGGLRIFFLLGNRDFYMRGGAFEARTGLRIVDGRTEHRLTVAGRNVYLCHGEYLEGRTDRGFHIQELIRSQGIERAFECLPARVAKALAEFYRGRSGRKPRRKIEPSRQEVLKRFRDGVDIIVCGHFHVHRAEPFQVDGRQAILYTLGDWSGGASFLVEENGDWRLGGRV
jgi:UDP-2,3-diacylglucosamine hydrolase